VVTDSGFTDSGHWNLTSSGFSFAPSIARVRARRGKTTWQLRASTFQCETGLGFGVAHQDDADKGT
jgi:hypothetical protein